MFVSLRRARSGVLALAFAFGLASSIVLAGCAKTESHSLEKAGAAADKAIEKAKEAGAEAAKSVGEAADTAKTAAATAATSVSEAADKAAVATKTAAAGAAQATSTAVAPGPAY